MKFSIYYSIDDGITKMLVVPASNELSLYHIDDPDVFRRSCVHIVYTELTNNRQFPVGKITIVHVALSN